MSRFHDTHAGNPQRYFKPTRYENIGNPQRVMKLNSRLNIFLRHIKTEHDVVHKEIAKKVATRQ